MPTTVRPTIVRPPASAGAAAIAARLLAGTSRQMKILAGALRPVRLARRSMLVRRPRHRHDRLPVRRREALGLALQDELLANRPRSSASRPTQRPGARVRLLGILAAPGGLQTNTPIEFITETSERPARSPVSAAGRARHCRTRSPITTSAMCTGERRGSPGPRPAHPAAGAVWPRPVLNDPGTRRLAAASPISGATASRGCAATHSGADGAGHHTLPPLQDRGASGWMLCRSASSSCLAPTGRC